MTTNTWIPATIAAVRLQLSREAVVRRVQRGLLRGQLTPDGSWVVDAAAVDRSISALASEHERAARAAQGKPE